MKTKTNYELGIRNCELRTVEFVYNRVVSIYSHHKSKITHLFVILLICFNAFGQIKHQSHQRALLGVKDEWHKIVLPDEIFEKSSADLSDLRILGLTEKDTIEAPYILRLAKEQITFTEINFKLINQSKNDQGYFFTFEVPTENTVNEIKLAFKQANFDWKLVLEGSQDQQKWFSILDDYRILSIKNELTDFEFTKVAFPNSKYRYFRLLVNTQKDPEFTAAKLLLSNIIEGNYKKYAINNTKILQDKASKSTIIDINLQATVPVSKLTMAVKNQYDYYRPITIQMLADSFKTKQGWDYNYSTLASGTLNSIEKKQFSFENTILKKLRIIIENQDNEPLKIDSFVVEGNTHELLARFTETANYYLTYSNAPSNKPQYDIERFVDKIPKTLTALELGEEQTIQPTDNHVTAPLFQNKMWLWAIMGIIIVLLGWFTLKMMKNE